MEKAYPDGFSMGGISISLVKVNGKKAEVSYSDNQQIMQINHKLKRNKKIRIDMEYTIILPVCQGRFGKGKDSYKLNNAFPILCAYKDGWLTDGYTTIGDPFYSDVSNYQVTFTAPKSLIVASTGELMSQHEDGSFRRATYSASAVRDFALVASDKFSISQDKVGRTTVTSYSLEPDGGQQALSAACKALKSYNEVYGEYPYNSLDVVCSDFFIGGMEYPNLIMIDRELYSNECHPILEYVTVHETAHQWWYGLVGNDQIREPWLDEALTEYSTLLYYDLVYGSDVYNSYFDILVSKQYKDVADAAKDEKIDKPTTEFANNEEYSAIVYSKGAMMFRAISELMGREKFLDALKDYCKEYSFKNVSKPQLINTLEKHSDIDLDGVFDAWFNDKVLIQ
jgi:aminopeptidase N